MAKKSNSGSGRAAKKPRFPLNPLAPFPRLLSLKQHLGFIEKVALPTLLSAGYTTESFPMLASVKKTIDQCEKKQVDVSEEEFARCEMDLTFFSREFDKGGRLGPDGYKFLAEQVEQDGVIKTARKISNHAVEKNMFVKREMTDEQIENSRKLPPLCITWLFAAARFLPPFAEGDAPEEQLSLYRYIDREVSPERLLQMSVIPCITVAANGLEERCANLFLLMCAVFLEPAVAEPENDEFWTVQWKSGARRQFRTLLWEDFSEYFESWDQENFEDVEKLLYSAQTGKDDAEEVDIRAQYFLPSLERLNSHWMSAALCFSVWLRKRHGESVYVVKKQKEEPSFVTVHRCLQQDIEDLRILLSRFGPNGFASAVTSLFPETNGSLPTSAEDCEKYLEEGGVIAAFLKALAKAAEQQETVATSFISLLRACIHHEIATQALFLFSVTQSDTETDVQTRYISLTNIRHQYAEQFHCNTEIRFGNDWHPLPPYAILNAVCFAIYRLVPDTDTLSALQAGEALPKEATLPGGVYDFSALVCSLLEEDFFSVVCEERRKRRVLPAIKAARKMLGEDELTNLQSNLQKVRESLKDARSAADLTAAGTLHSLEERLTSSEREIAALQKKLTAIAKERDDALMAAEEKSAALEALLSSLSEPEETPVLPSSEELARLLSNLSLAFCGGHIQRLQELRDLGIVPKLTIATTRLSSRNASNANIDAIVVFTDWVSHKSFYHAEQIRKTTGAARVYCSGSTNIDRILQTIWLGLPDSLKKKAAGEEK